MLMIAPYAEDGTVDINKSMEQVIQVVMDDEAMEDDKILANFVRKGILTIEQTQKPIINGRPIPTESRSASKQ